MFAKLFPTYAADKTCMSCGNIIWYDKRGIAVKDGCLKTKTDNYLAVGL